MEILSLFITAVFAGNFVMVKFYGICPFLGVSKKTDTAVGMGMAVTFVMAMSSAITYLANRYLLVPYQLEYLQTILFILIIAGLVQFVEMVVKKVMPSLYNALGIYLPLITTNCAVLGVTINNINDGFAFSESMVSSLGCGLGFLLAMVLFAGLRSRIDEAEVPKAFKGVAVTLIAASFISLAFMGLDGIVDNIFGVGGN